MKHTDKTSRCHHSKAKLQIDGQCRCFYRVGERKNARKEQCPNEAVLRAHMHDEGGNNFVLVNACKGCNNKHKTTVYVHSKDCVTLSCACAFRMFQTPHHPTRRM